MRCFMPVIQPSVRLDNIHSFETERQQKATPPLQAFKRDIYVSSTKQEATNMDTPRRHLKQRERSHFLFLQSIESDKQPANMELRRSPFKITVIEKLKIHFQKVLDVRGERRATEKL